MANSQHELDAIISRMEQAGETPQSIAGVVQAYHAEEGPPTPTGHPGTEPGTFWGGFTKHMLTKEPGASVALGGGVLAGAAAAGVPAAVIGGASAALPLAAYVAKKVAGIRYNKTPMTPPTLGEGAEILSGPLAEYGAPAVGAAARAVKAMAPEAKQTIGALLGAGGGVLHGGPTGAFFGAKTGSWAIPKIANSVATMGERAAETVDQLRPSQLAIRLGAKPSSVSLASQVRQGGTSGARTLELTARQLGEEIPLQPLSGGESTVVPYGGSSTGPAPYRASARAAVKADEATVAAADNATQNAARLVEIERRKTGLVSTKPTVRESLSATTPKGGRASSSVRFAPPKKVDLAPSGPPPLTLPGGQVLQRSDNPAIYDAIQAERTRNVGGLRETPPQTPPSAPTDAAGRDLGGLPGPERRTLTGASPTGLERRGVASVDQPISGTIAERASQMRAENPQIDTEAAAMKTRAAGTVGPPVPDQTTVAAFFADHAAEIEALSAKLDAEGNVSSGAAAKAVGRTLRDKYRDQFPALADLTAPQLESQVRAVRAGPVGRASPDLLKIARTYMDKVKTPEEAYNLFHGIGYKPGVNAPIQDLYKAEFDRTFPGWNDPRTH